MNATLIKQLLITLGILINFVSSTLATNYYVNDATPSDPNDVFTTGIGATGNPGSKAFPKLSIQAVISLGLAGGDSVFIDGGNYTEEVLLSGISGGGTNIVFIGAGTTKTVIQGIAGTTPTPYTIQLLNSSYIKWQNLKVISVSAEWGFSINNNSHHNTISNCSVDADQYAVDIYRLGPGAGTVSPADNIVEKCTLAAKYVGVRIKSNNLGGWATSAAVGPINNIIRDNSVTVQNVSPSPFSAMEFQACRGNSVYRNKFSLTGNSIGGTIFVGHFSSGIVLNNNYIVNHTTFLNASSPNPGIMFDDNSGCSIVHNSVYAESHAFYFINGQNDPNLSNVNLYNNILYSNLKNSICLPNKDAKFNNCDGNMYYAPSGSVASSLSNASMTLAFWQSSYDPDLGAANELLGFNNNPNYTAPASNNLDLVAGSPAIDVVNVASAISDDIYTTSRPQGAKKDVGAFETVTLPINLIHFGASCSNGQIEITWVTASEINNDYFVLERSDDLKTFTEVTRITGSGTTQKTKTYQYTDTYSGKNAYYRLRQVDFDGKFSYSKFVHSNCTSQNILIAEEEDSVKLIYTDAAPGEQIEITVFSITGQELIRKIIPVSHENSVTLETSALPASMYILCAKKGVEVFTTKIIKK